MCTNVYHIDSNYFKNKYVGNYNEMKLQLSKLFHYAKISEMETTDIFEDCFYLFKNNICIGYVQICLLTNKINNL